MTMTISLARLWHQFQVFKFKAPQATLSIGELHVIPASFVVIGQHLARAPIARGHLGQADDHCLGAGRIIVAPGGVVLIDISKIVTDTGGVFIAGVRVLFFVNIFVIAGWSTPRR